MNWISVQPKSERIPPMRWLRAVGCLLLLAIGALAQAIQPVGKAETTTPTAPTSSVTPLYLEKSTSSYSLKPEDGWQVGGLNTRYATSGDAGALGFSGGYFYSRTLAPRPLIDPRDPLPSRLGQETPTVGDMPTLFRLFQTGPSDQKSLSDQVTYQRWNYAKSGLNFSGGYSDVGADFKGLDALKQQLTGADPATAKSLAQGMAQRDYAMSYAGIRGMNFTSKYTQVENGQAGSAEKGLTRTNRADGVGLALGARNRLDFTTTSLIESWDPKAGAHVNKDVETQALRLSGALGGKSEFAIGQQLTSTTTGAQQADVTQRNVALKWREWKSLGLTAGYTTTTAEQTQETTDTLTLDLAAPISPYFSLTGKLAQSNIERRQTGQTQEQNLLDMKLTSQLTPHLQLTTRYQDNQALDASTMVSRDAQLAYALSDHWKATYRLTAIDTSNLGDINRREYGMTGQIGSKRQPRQISLFHRDEDMPNNISQGRTEVAFAQPLGGAGSPVTLQLKLGNYDFANPDNVKRNTLLTAQVLAMKPTPRTSFSMGYYNGPVVGANALTYRSWGQKVQANPDTAWKATDLADYGEVGGELTHALTGSTKLVAKQYHGNVEGIGAQETTEYGIEQHCNKMTLLAGQRTTATPAKQDQAESWWRLSLPSAQKLPTWAAGSLHATAFADSATWGFNQTPAWALKPAPGATVEQRNVIVAGTLIHGRALQYATMLGSRLFVQGSYEVNPNLPNNANGVDPVQRGLLHVAFIASPTVTLFTRYVDEGKLDGSAGQCTRTLGLIGTLSKVERLQMQMDIIRQSSAATVACGNVYTLEYERALSADDTLTLKARVSGTELVAKADRVRLEGSYQRTF